MVIAGRLSDRHDVPRAGLSPQRLSCVGEGGACRGDAGTGYGNLIATIRVLRTARAPFDATGAAQAAAGHSVAASGLPE